MRDAPASLYRPAGRCRRVALVGVWVTVLLRLVAAIAPIAGSPSWVHAYDAPVVARVDVQSFGDAEANEAQLGDLRQASSVSSVEAHGRSTTSIAPRNATNTAPFGEIGPAGNPGLLPTQQHHVFPQKYRSTFENAGVAIDDFTVPLNRTQHLKGVHGSGLPGQGLPGRLKRPGIGDCSFR